MIYYNADDLAGLIGEDYKRADYEEIIETARLLSGNDHGVIEKMEFAVDDPKGYFESLSERSAEWSRFFPDKFLSLYDALVYMMIFELEERGYFTEVRWKCRLEAFLRSLSELKNYELIKDAVEKAANQFMTGRFVEDYCGEINEAADGKAYICRTPYFEDHFEKPLIIVDAGTLEKVQNISEYSKKLVEPYPNKDLFDPLAEFFGGYTPKNGENLLEAARLLSDNDEEVIEAVRSAVQNIKRYYYRNLGGYENFSIYMEDIADGLYYDDWKPDPEKLLFLGMINELFQHRYIYWVYRKTALHSFLEDLKILRNYELIKDVIPGIKFDENGDVKSWCSKINGKPGKARLCCIEPDIPDKLNVYLAIITDEKIKELIPDLFNN